MAHRVTLTFAPVAFVQARWKELSNKLRWILSTVFVFRTIMFIWERFCLSHCFLLKNKIHYRLCRGALPFCSHTERKQRSASGEFRFPLATKIILFSQTRFADTSIVKTKSILIVYIYLFALTPNGKGCRP